MTPNDDEGKIKIYTSSIIMKPVTNDDDDTTTSSSGSSSSSSNEEEAATATTKKAKRCNNHRRARFVNNDEEEVCVQIQFIPLKSEEEKRKMFYSAYERSKIMHTIQGIVIDIEEENNTLSCSTRRGMHNNNNDNIYSYGFAVSRAFQACCPRGKKLTREELLFFRHHYLAAGDDDDDDNTTTTTTSKSNRRDSRRGLEKYANKRLQEQSEIARRHSIRSVVEQYSKAMADHGYISEVTEDTIIKTYREHTCAFRRFAGLKGRMDKLAAAKIRTEEEAQKKVPDHYKNHPSKNFNGELAFLLDFLTGGRSQYFLQNLAF